MWPFKQFYLALNTLPRACIPLRPHPSLAVGSTWLNVSLKCDNASCFPGWRMVCVCDCTHHWCAAPRNMSLRECDPETEKVSPLLPYPATQQKMQAACSSYQLIIYCALYFQQKQLQGGKMGQSRLVEGASLSLSPSPSFSSSHGIQNKVAK